MLQMSEFVPRLGRACGHTFVKSWIGVNSKIVDLGMNQGAFANYIMDHFSGARIYGCEPVPALFEKLRRRFYDGVLNVAVGGKTEFVPLQIYETLCASACFANLEPECETIQVRMLSLDDFVEMLGLTRIDLLKVDIEGAELAMILQASNKVLKDCDQISIEFHDFLDRSQIADIRKAISRLRSLGFEPFRCSILNRSDVLFVHERKRRHRGASFIIRLQIIRNHFAMGKARNFVKYVTDKTRSRLAGGKFSAAASIKSQTPK